MRLPVLASWILLALCAIAHYLIPIGTDQAFYAEAASAVSRGAELYGPLDSDATDHRGPGVFLFYLAAGSPLTVRRLEVLLWIAAGIAAAISFRRRSDSSLFQITAPWAVGGCFVLGASQWTGTQPESIATPFLVFAACALVSAMRYDEDWGHTRVAPLCGLSGLIIGISASINVALFIAVIGFGIVLLTRMSQPLPAVLWYSIGVAAALFWIGLVFGMNTWPRFVTDWFELQSQPDLPWFHGRADQLLASMLWMIRTMGIWLVLAIVLLVRFPFDRDALVGTVWLASTLAAFALEPFGWWAFKSWPAVSAVGLLGALGLASLADSSRRPVSYWAVGAIVLFAIPLVPRWATAVGQTARVADARITSLHEQIVELRRYKIPDEAGLFVFGEPYLSWAIERPRVSRRTGWAGELYGETMWRYVRDTFDRQARSNPGRPFLVSLDRYHEKKLQQRGKRLLGWLDQHCQELFEADDRRWSLCGEPKPLPIVLPPRGRDDSDAPFGP